MTGIFAYYCDLLRATLLSQVFVRLVLSIYCIYCIYCARSHKSDTMRERGAKNAINNIYIYLIIPQGLTSTTAAAIILRKYAKIPI